MPRPKLPTITAHMVVKNDDRFVWFAVNSVLPYVDRFLITDTGSTDGTVGIIQSIKSPKIFFQTVTAPSPKDIVSVRQHQLDQTQTEWIWIVDGDEIYPDKTVTELINLTNQINSSIWGIVVPFYNWVGDIYHVQSESKGQYRFGNRLGHLNLRLIRNLPGLNVAGTYPTESYVYNNQPLQNYTSNLAFITSKFYHAGNLNRSSVSKNALSRKIVYDLGLPLTGPLPEILKSTNAPVSVNQSRTKIFFILSIIKYLAQRIIKPSKHSAPKPLHKTLWSHSRYYHLAQLSSTTGHPALNHLISNINSFPLLEFGAGEGTKLSLFKPGVKVALDISPTGLKLAKQKSLVAIRADAGLLPFLDRTFASVVSLFSLEHVSNPELVLKEMVRVTQPGGSIGIVAPNFGAPNRASPCFSGNRIIKLIVGLLRDLIPYRNNNLHWHPVTPNSSITDYQPDSDTTVEPYLGTLIEFLKFQGLKINYFNSYWDLPQKQEPIWQKYFKYLGLKRIYPFKLWGPHAYVLAQKPAL